MQHEISASGFALPAPAGRGVARSEVVRQDLCLPATVAAAQPNAPSWLSLPADWTASNLPKRTPIRSMILGMAQAGREQAQQDINVPLADAAPFQGFGCRAHAAVLVTSTTGRPVAT